MRGCRPTVAAVLAVLLSGPLQVPALADARSAAIRRAAFEHAYNLDRAEAVRLLERGVAEHRDDPAMHRALASVLWLQMLFERGAATADHYLYLGSFSRTQVALKGPRPELDTPFRLHVAKAIELGEALFPGEDAVWRYKRGTARAALQRTTDARADLTAALGDGAQDWVSGRATVELARLAVRGGDHEAALDLSRRAEALCVQGNDRPCAEDARRLARSARGQ